MIGRLSSALAGVPVVHHVHGQTLNFGSNRRLNRINALVESASLVDVPAVIAVSGTTKHYLRRQYVPSRVIRVVPNGEPARGTLPPRPRPAGTWTLGAVAMFLAIKSLHVLLYAKAQLQTAGMPVRLRAVGYFHTAAEESETKGLADRLGVSGIDMDRVLE